MVKNERFFNRELSWLEFNYRVLEEALNEENPLLERLKFLSIFSNNLDEFVMVRVAGVISQVNSGYDKADYSGHTPREVLDKVISRLQELVGLQYKCLTGDVLPALEKEGIVIYKGDNLPEEYFESLKDLFLKKYFLMLTPMAVDQAHPFPFLKGKSLNILVRLHDKKKAGALYAVVPVPEQKRFIPIPDTGGDKKFIYVEEFVKLFASHLFKGYTIEKTCTFRITRDAELQVAEEEAVDLLSAIEDELKKRERGNAVRLEVEERADKELLDFLYDNIKFFKGCDFTNGGPLDLASFFAIAFIDGFSHLKCEPLPPVMPRDFEKKEESVFDIISGKDILVHHPYESFDPVVRFIREAASDPGVLAIKMTLYRTSGDSPIIKSLKRAAENGKQVTVLVELKARFDEAQNINWAKQLEKVGCHVVYGLVGLKTHSKIALVVRDEGDEIKRYIHLGTGNYNDKTARIYTDMGLFTCKRSVGRDGSAIFNLLTGYSEPPRWKKLITAPLDLRNFFLEKIEVVKKNIQNGSEGRIIAKMNSLVDIKIIEALYEASCAGVKIDLIIRGMCRLRPGVKGLSEHIRVISIIDRYLEHSRIFYFTSGGNEEVYLSSADWMERNFDRRVEICFPVEDSKLKHEIKENIDIILEDNQKTRYLTKDGTYTYKIAKKGKQIQSQVELYSYYVNKNMKEKKSGKISFVPKTKPE